MQYLNVPWVERKVRSTKSSFMDHALRVIVHDPLEVLLKYYFWTLKYQDSTLKYQNTGVMANLGYT